MATRQAEEQQRLVDEDRCVGCWQPKPPGWKRRRCPGCLQKANDARKAIYRATHPDSKMTACGRCLELGRGRVLGHNRRTCTS